MQELVGKKIRCAEEDIKVYIKIEFVHRDFIKIGETGYSFIAEYPIENKNKMFLYVAPDLEQAKSVEFMDNCFKNVMKYIKEGVLEKDENF